MSVALKPAFHRYNDEMLILLILFGEVQEMCNAHKICHERLKGIGLDPQDNVVVVLIAIGIFDSRLCLADATQSTDGLRQCGGLPSSQCSIEAFKHIFSTGEIGIALVGNIPKRERR